MATRADLSSSELAEPRRHEWLRKTTAAILIVTMVVAGLIPLLPSIINLAIVPDFTMFWTGGQFALHSPALLYDIDAVTAAQDWIRNPKAGPTPFIYPPTSLLLFVPLGLMPFWYAFAVWTIVSVVAFWTAARRLTSGLIASLSLLSPWAMLVILLGQTTLLAGAAVLWSLALLRNRPVLAGALMALAAAIKPQSAFLAPVAYLSGRNWTAMVAAACTWLLLALASLAFGPGLWIDWFNALPAFPEILDHWNLFKHGATPSMLAIHLGVDPTPFLIGGILAGVAFVWFGSKSEDTTSRALTFVGGTLIASPYAMNYELTMMAPMLVAAMLSTTLIGLVIASPLFGFRVYLIAPALLVSGAVATWRSRRSDLPMRALDCALTRSPDRPKALP